MKIKLFKKIKKKFKNEEKNEKVTLSNKTKELIKKDNTNVILKINMDDEEKKKRVLSLTSRERDTYLLLLEGFTLKEVAKQLGVKYSTVNTHMSAIYKKLGVNTRAELIIGYRMIKEGGNRI